MPTISGNVDVHTEWDTLKAARIALDEELIVWIAVWMLRGWREIFPGIAA